MNKFFRIGCLIIFILGIIAIVGVSIERWHDSPTQTIAFLNTSDATRSVTFERIENDGKLAETYTIDSDIKPNQTIIEKVPAGNYKVSVWNQDKSLYKSTDFEVKLKDPKKSNYQLYRYDIAMDKIYAVVNLNALYKGNWFADYMANSTGTKLEKLRIEKLYYGGQLFFVRENYTSRTFIDIDDKLPKKVKYGEVVYGLFEFPKTLPDNQIEAAIYTQIAEKMK
jgi:hypothetical protein